MLYPLFAMVLLTFCVALLTLQARVQAVRSGAVDPNSFRLMQGDGMPESITLTTKHFANLFEMPVLFYIVGTLYIAMDLQSTYAVITAWLFVLFRGLHACIHLTYNNVMHRLSAFMAGNLCILALWVMLVMSA